MFGKKKKEPKIEKVFDSKNDTPAEDQDKVNKESDADLAEFKTGKEEDNSGLTEVQKKKVEKLGNVKDKISKILKSSNIEIVDENLGDEYEFDGNVDSAQQQQQDYDALKALFGNKEKSKGQELTLTIDDFDYTYVGQYVEEYDLMHLKSIKKIRLQKKHSKHFKRIILAACLVVVLGLGGFLGYYFTRETPVYIKAVTLNQVEHDYFLDEYFDYTGIYYIVEYSNGVKKTVPLSQSNVASAIANGNVMGRVNTADGNIKFTGISSQTSPTYITFQYSGFSVRYDINVRSRSFDGLIANVSDGFFSLNAGTVVNSDYLKLYASYEDYGNEAMTLAERDLKFYVNGVEQVYEVPTGRRVYGGFKLTTDIRQDSIIKITYTLSVRTVELEFSYVNGINSFSKIVDFSEEA